VLQAAPVVSLIIVDIGSPGGPGTVRLASYVAAINAAHAAGQTVVGYVDTNYASRPFAELSAEIDLWYQLYPTIDGIFFDEVTISESPIAGYYAPAYAHVKAMPGRAIVVINPGTTTSESYMSVADIVMSYEDSYAGYVNAFTPPAWVWNYPASRFWNVIMNAPSAAEMQNAVRLSRERHVGYVFVTNLDPANAFRTLPSYWDAEIAAIAGR
jgi:hypothetical protein